MTFCYVTGSIRLSRRGRLDALRSYRGKVFTPPEGGEVLLRCQEGELMVHEDVSEPKIEHLCPYKEITTIQMACSESGGCMTT